MANPLQNLLQKLPLNSLPLRAGQFLSGLAQDFWHDGPENPFRRGAGTQSEFHTELRAEPRTAQQPAAAKPAAASLWHALAGEISEKMWGDGFVTPASDAVTDMLIKPLGLNKQMSVLDLSAGLGGRMRRITKDFGVYVTGLEPDPGIAARGMEMSARLGKGKQDAISHYTPATFSAGKTVTQSYDCIIACETFYRVQDKQKFFAALTACTKPQAQVSYTDYIVNPENRKNAAIVAWQNYEKDTTPLGLIETAEGWAKEGFKLRVNDDQTDFYRKEVVAGLQRLATFLGTMSRPDLETRNAILRRMEIWAHRLAAMEQGMKFYRFYGTR
ncbi:MAG: methyltransferase domain-containing protein [Pseudomonadota bacterium]|nr:methyltransferase domain-containing protein [Pseudomonadota bacterium]